ncbi:unnamed protein product [Scytosiphon promiscuus]
MLRRCLPSRGLSHVTSQRTLASARATVDSSADSITAPFSLPPRYRPRSRDNAATPAGLAMAVHNRGRFSSSSFSTAATTEDIGTGAPSREAEEHDGAFEDPRNAILDAALDHVEAHGFSATALAAGAKDCGFHSVAAGMFPKGQADLVHHLMAKALQEVKKLSEETPATKRNDSSEGDSEDGDESSSEFDSEWAPSETDRLREGIKAALSCLAPYKTHWPHAMSIGLLPQNAGATATAVAVLADELAFLSGDRSTDLAWYGKRGVIAGMYASTELFMLTDESEGLSETWAFLDRLLSDYEILATSPENAADVATGVSTVAMSLSSAAVSLAGPFLRQASKQVPGAESLAQTAPNVASLASQALSFVASQVPHAGQQSFGGSASVSGPSQSASAATSTASATDGYTPAGEAPPTFPGAPERDPWSETPGASASGKPGEFEEELVREERELFGRNEGGGKK